MPEPVAAPAAPASGAPALDETMLAMDVVDTIRHADRLVERELSGEDRQQRLRERLREIYKSQGIEVADHVLDQGGDQFVGHLGAAQPDDRDDHADRPASESASAARSVSVSRS